eukprot:jgi/Chlat1/7123/Chrsp57S09124
MAAAAAAAAAWLRRRRPLLLQLATRTTTRRRKRDHCSLVAEGAARGEPELASLASSPATGTGIGSANASCTSGSTSGSTGALWLYYGGLPLRFLAERAENYVLTNLLPEGVKAEALCTKLRDGGTIVYYRACEGSALTSEEVTNRIKQQLDANPFRAWLARRTMSVYKIAVVNVHTCVAHTVSLV